MTLSQGSQSISIYAIEFRILATESGWNEFALQGAFVQGLSKEIKDELAITDETALFLFPYIITLWKEGERKLVVWKGILPIPNPVS